MCRHSLWSCTFFLLLFASGVLPADDSSKESPKGTTIFPDTVTLNKGGGLSYRTPVGRPRPIKGVRSWTVETRRHRWAAIVAAVSPNGRLVASGGYDGMIRMWDPATGNLVRVLVGHESYVYGLAWSADGRYLASTGSFDATVRVWEAKTGLPVKVLRGLKEAAVSVAWSPDGALLAAGTIESGYVSIWRIATGTLVKTVSNGKMVGSLVFSPDGMTLACGVSQVGVLLRGGEGWAVTSQLDMTGQEPRGVSFSADGKQLVVGGAKQIIAWDPAAKKTVRQIDVPAFALACHGRQVAVVSPAGKMHDLDTGKPGAALPAGQVVSWSADGKVLCVLSGDDILSIDPTKGTELKRWSVAETGTLMWAPGRPILSGLGSAKPRLWDTGTTKPTHTLEGHTAGVSVAAWSPGGKILATGGLDRTVRVWDPVTGKCVRTLEGFEGAVTSLAVAGDGKIAAGAADQKVRIFAPLATKPLRTHTGHTDAVKALAWGPDGRLASGGLDAAIRIWGTDANKPVHTLENAGSVECLAFAPSGRFLAAGAAEHQVRVWSYPGRKLLHELSSLGSPPAVTGLAWSTDSSMLLAGRANHTLQLWDVKSGKLLHSITVMAPVQSVWMAAGGKLMATCTIDRCVRFWTTANAQIHSTVLVDGNQLSCISTEGYYRIPNQADTELVCVALTKTGMDTYPPKEFATNFGWMNNPASARIPGK
jgi:WD40 repeat protein